ncbi:motility associated factor glycosyltransferase family protein [Ornithinibacillus sp. 179-J 7C1 HS]|uniref:motility associated factor glycosyltransferase family protein n=1 Tax=Ornithinibacillus sp. 179-J 7C1 HS TaxID=3142384 RepID=UPI00399F1A23
MLIDNKLFLMKKHPTLRDYFRDNETSLETARVEVVDSNKGLKTLQYLIEDKQMMIHSKYDPIREAERIIAAHKDEITDDTHVFFYGIGLGYHIEKFCEAFPKNTYSIYEPIPEIFFTALKNVDLKRIMRNNLSNFYMDTHSATAKGYLQELQSRNQHILFIILPSYKNIVKEKVQHFQDGIKRIVQNRRSNLSVDMSFQKLWVLNSILNFKAVLDTPNMLKDIDRKQFEGKPVIIVSAGPSLAEDIEHLRYIKENNLAYLFSVGSAINSLIKYDVLPDAVCTYDPGRNNHVVFNKMIEKGIRDIPMIFGSSVGYETITQYEGPKVHFITSQDKTSTYLLQGQIEPHDLIIDSPSIAVMMFQLLNKLKAGPIIFAGQNLGYLYDRRYSDGIEYKHVESMVDKQEMDNAITTEDVYGNEIKTNSVFNRMRETIEHFARVYAVNTFINTTKGGAAIEGVPFYTIEEVIKNVLLEPINKQEWWKVQNQYNQSVVQIQNKKVMHSINEFQELLRKMYKVIESISTSTKVRNKSNIESALSQFDTLYNAIFENIYYKNFLSLYMRVDVEYIENEIRRLNRERDPFIKGREVFSVFSGYLEKCKCNSHELNEILIKMNF